MSDEIYKNLRQQLDNYALGYPATGSGVEIKILQHIFSVAAAELYLQMSLKLEEPAAVAERTGRPTAEAITLQVKPGKVEIPSSTLEPVIKTAKQRGVSPD